MTPGTSDGVGSRKGIVLDNLHCSHPKITPDIGLLRQDFARWPALKLPI